MSPGQAGTAATEMNPCHASSRRGNAACYTDSVLSGLIKGWGSRVEVVIFILAPIFILIFAAVVRVLGTSLGYKVLLAFLVLYFLVRR